MNARYWLILGLTVSLPAAPAAAQGDPGDPPPPDPFLSPEQPLYGGFYPSRSVKVFYLGPWGSPQSTAENNTILNPFLTLEQARSQVSQWINGHGHQQIVVKVAGGLYPMTGPVTFTERDSGQPGAVIAYQSYNPMIPGFASDDVLFSGGVQLSGTWNETVPGSHIYSISVPVEIPVTEVRDLWVNNQRMVRSRWPHVPTPVNPATYTDPLTPPASSENRALSLWST
jgi:hypothetical protein